VYITLNGNFHGITLTYPEANQFESWQLEEQKQTTKSCGIGGI
jgi:hypothetical protein